MIRNLSGSSADYYFAHDHQYSPVALFELNGDVVQHYGYTAYGIERYQDNALAFEVFNRNTGQSYDDDTGLYCNGARYYDAVPARYIQADPVLLSPASLSRGIGIPMSTTTRSSMLTRVVTLSSVRVFS